MKTFRNYAVLVVLGLLLAACGSTNNSTAAPTNTPATPDFDQFLTLVNEFRSQPQVCKRGEVEEEMPAVGPVTYNDALNTATRLHSEYMATSGNFDHTGENGSSFSQRNTAAGYAGDSIGENIAVSSADVEGTFNQWRTSTRGHCQGMMSRHATEIGLGYGFSTENRLHHYWTFVTGRAK
jgi:uncharacterized protein YkwD